MSTVREIPTGSVGYHILERGRFIYYSFLVLERGLHRKSFKRTGKFGHRMSQWIHNQ